MDFVYVGKAIVPVRILLAIVLVAACAWADAAPPRPGSGSKKRSPAKSVSAAARSANAARGSAHSNSFDHNALGNANRGGLRLAGSDGTPQTFGESRSPSKVSKAVADFNFDDDVAGAAAVDATTMEADAVPAKLDAPKPAAIEPVPMPEPVVTPLAPMEGPMMAESEMLTDGYADPADWDEDDYWDAQPHEPEGELISTRSWINGGKWYSRAEYVYLTRYASESILLAGDFSRFNNFGQPYEVLRTTRGQGFQPGMRLTFGKNVFRDYKDRQHSLEFTFFGLFDFDFSRGLSARGVTTTSGTGNGTTSTTTFNQISTPLDAFLGTNAQVGGFNNVATTRYRYRSSLDSYEANYVISTLGSRDKIELDRHGEWQRVTSEGPRQSIIGGVRVITVGEGFEWTAAANDPTVRNGRYVVSTTNDLVGAQIGYQFEFIKPKFRFGAKARAGAFANYATVSHQVNIVDPTVTLGSGNNTTTVSKTQSRNENARAQDMAFMMDLYLGGSYQFRPNVVFRSGFDLMWLNQIALAPENLTFVPSVPPAIVTGGGSLYLGASIGLDFTW